MAIQITGTFTTDEGFEVINPFCFINQYFVGTSNWANLSYYKSKEQFQSGSMQLNINTFPSRVSTSVTNAVFWGNSGSLMDYVHNEVTSSIENASGVGSCTIDKTF